MKIEWPFFLYGGDYNPEQWPREVWDEDVRLMRKAGWNVATLPVFGWASLEPEEGQFDFEWLDDIVERLHGGGIRLCFATATASVPAWVTEKYPDVLTVNEQGIRQKHGNRHVFCSSSPNYRRLSTNLVRKIAERYGSHPALLLWHVNNEYSNYCYCELCAAEFRRWLRRKYGTLEALNDAWYTKFWGHTYSDWEQIDTPTTNGEHSIQAFRVDYRRFMSDALLDLFKAERDILREFSPDVPVTTNLMGAYFPLDYHRWGREMDIASWDNYPSGHNLFPASFHHVLMRGLREGQPFLLMEQSPSQQNWQPYNQLKSAGELRLQSFQAVAHGADSVMYFQWRRGRGGIEKLHGAVVEHGGNEENRVFREVAALGEELGRLGTQIQGARSPARVAVLFDWPNWWALKLSSGPSVDLDYFVHARDCFLALRRLGIDVEILSPEADLSRFDVIVAPMLTMLRTADADRVRQRVSEGATLVATAFTGLVDENDLVFLEGAPGPWRNVLGLRVEETGACPEGGEVTWTEESAGSSTHHLLIDRLVLEGASPVVIYRGGPFDGEPAVTRHEFGAGLSYYLGTYLNASGYEAFFDRILVEKGIGCVLGEAPPTGVEVSVRVRQDGERHLFLLNHDPKSSKQITLPEGAFVDLLSGEGYEGALTLEPMGVRVLRC